MKTEIFPAGQKNIEETPEFPGIVNFDQLNSFPLNSVIRKYNNYFLRPALYSVFAKISSSFKAYYVDPDEIRNEVPAIKERPLTSSEIYDFNQDIQELKKLYKKLLELFDSLDNGMPFPLRCSKIIIEYCYVAYKIPLKFIYNLDVNNLISQFNTFNLFFTSLTNLAFCSTVTGPYQNSTHTFSNWSTLSPMGNDEKIMKTSSPLSVYNQTEFDFSNDPESLWQLGICYVNGSHGFEQNPKKGVNLFQQGSLQGHAKALNSLGYCYFNGLGVVKDINEAVRLYRLAVDKGHVDAQYNLGICYRNGHGVDRDHKEAVRLFRLSAEQKHSPARGYLANYYYTGQGVEKDDKEAFRLFRLSANQENNLNNQRHKESIKALINFYKLGIGVIKDVNESRQWEIILKQEEKSTARSSPNSGP